MTAPYDANNIFAKILRGEIPSHKVYEDEETYAFMDVMPQGKGHCLAITKAPFRNILDVDQANLSAVIATTQKLARAVKVAFRRRWRHCHPVQRTGRRADGFPPAFPYHSAF